MTLAFEGVYSKLVEVVTVAHVDDDNSSVQIWKVNLVIKLSFCSDLSTRFQGLVNILKLMFRQDFEAEVQSWSRF